MKRVFLLFCLLLFIELPAQTVLNWSDLEHGITWSKASLKLYPGFSDANFSDQLNALEGEKVTLTGFLLVLDGRQSIYMLSKNPMASCFFCGNGGFETIAEIVFAQKHSFKMDDLVTISGILRLNTDDPTNCYYRIEQAEGFVL